MTKAVDFKEGHIDLFEILETEDISPEDWESLKSDEEYIANCPSMDVVTIICDNNIVALVGAKTISTGVVHVWMIPGKPYKQYRIAVHKQILSLLDSIREKNHRVQISVKSTFKQGKDWAVSLGFKFEGTMVEFDKDGSNHDLYVRF